MHSVRSEKSFFNAHIINQVGLGLDKAIGSQKIIPCPLSSAHLHPKDMPEVHFSHYNQRELLNMQISMPTTSVHLNITLLSLHCIFQSFSKSLEHNMLTLLSRPLHMLFHVLGRPFILMSTNQIPHLLLDNCCLCFRSQMPSSVESLLSPHQATQSLLSVPLTFCVNQ